MKRTLTILIIILIGLGLIFSFLGRGGDYAAEKAIYKVNQQFARIQKDPLATPDAEFKEVVQGYREFVEDHPDSHLAPFAHILIGRTHILKKDYQKAREVFERIRQKYDEENPRLAAQALLETANAYAQENDVANVLRSYERIIENYPLTEQGLKAPFSIMKIKFSNKTVTETEFNQTLSYYRRLSVEHPHTAISFKALHYIAGMQMMAHNFRQAVEMYGEILLTYPEPEFINQNVALLILRSINTVAISNLQDYDTPIRIYTQFIQQYPEHPLTPTLKELVNGIKQLKQRAMENQQEPTAQQ